MSHKQKLQRPSTPPGVPPETSYRQKSKLSFGVVCSSNINRSMEAHVVLGNAGLQVESYGTGTQVRLPGRTAMEPRIFKFGTPYEEMYQSMTATQEDGAYFVKNGVLQLCQRGAAVKRAPQRWQDVPSEDVSKHAVVIAFEERIFDAVIEDLQLRQPTEDFKPIHVICLDTKDNPHEAARQGIVALRLCWMLEYCDDLDMEAAEIIDQFQQERDSETNIKILYQVCYL
mmetsp:Transcript_17953/g.23211  ORF Transcript_17953/g.23211 Transcript_17953/m.23211 type:complete len:228 (-) Transcript_17953:126-809(-)|eukprot:CAMPEP_0198139374 /NCGR_PEP_ID=MMETSP1443-20131203/2688_1 /TAXON_ID=186043 /ORGANISM="Entomoneis sp., Strain CCMP2396" /LENGTH=227 /DNA_ID=CAMNT_0043801485 /DNA_START=57 /DNA_END=740 /DNA_ORIENTATION=-